MTFSILIPTYNDPCYTLVKTLRNQLLTLDIEWELIVADDCSTDEDVRAENAKIEKLSGCRVVWGTENIGRAAIRNRLAEWATGDWLLFIDSGNAIKGGDFMRKYAEFFFKTRDAECVVYGGRLLNQDTDSSNLRYQYEHAWEENGKVKVRREDPYRSFNTCNFLISRNTMLRIPFNEDMKLYGFEDVLLGKQLKEFGVPVYHIDNPVTFGIYETNAEFLRKTEEAVRMQYDFREKIGNYSNLICVHNKLKKFGMTGPLHFIYKLIGKRLKQNLLGKHPKSFCFNLYKLLLFNSMGREQ